MGFNFKKVSRRFLAVALVLALCMGMCPQTAQNAQAATDAVINLNNTHQEIMGVGGMNHPTWAGDLTSSQRNTAFGNDTNQLGFQVLRIWVDSNRNNWYKELDTAKAAIAKGAIVFATPWNPPSDLCETFYKNGSSNAKRLKHDKYAAYAQHLNDFVTYMRNNGVELYGISVCNEPDYGHDWTWWTESEVVTFLKYYASSINCRIIAPESFSYQKSYYDAIINDSQALAQVDIIGTHLYGTSYNNFSYPLYHQKASSKNLWMTEVYTPNSTSSADTWPEAINVAEHIHKAMVNDFQTYVWWYIRRSYGPMKEDGTISKRGYCMAQFSKFVRKGYKRVDATENPNSGVYVSAYTGDGKAVIVAVNSGSSDCSQSFTIEGKTLKSVDRYRTSGSENLAKTSNLALSGNGFWAYLPANSVSTFVCNVENTSSDSTVSTSNISDGWYYIKNSQTGKYLQVTDNNGTAGANVEAGTGTGAAGQQWYVTNLSNGYVTIKNGLGNFNLDVANGATADNTNMIIYNSHGGDAQQFKISSTDNSSQYGILTKVSGNKSCVHLRQADYTNVVENAYWQGTNQVWQFEKIQTVASGSVSDGWYYIKNPQTGKYLQVTDNNGTAGANVEVGTGTGVAGQKWYVTNLSNGYVTIKNGLGSFNLDVANGATADNTNMIIYNSHGGDAQQFKISVTNDPTQFGILTKVSSDKSCVHLRQADYTNVVENAYWQGTNQVWQFEKTQ